MSAGEMAKAGSFGSYHDTEAFDLAKRSNVSVAVGGEACDLDPVFLKPLDGARQIHHTDHRNAFQRACCRPCQRA